MVMQRAQWEAIARRLPLNSSVRERCCRDDRSAIISSNVKGWSYYCFRCGASSFIPRQEGISVSEFCLSRKEVSKQVCALPLDFTKEIPEEGLTWLRRAGIDEELREIYNIGFSQKEHRVILQTTDGMGRLTYIQKRAVYEGQSPKYVNISAVKKPIFKSKQATTSEVIITEDILSAIKVGQVFSAISILGTKPVSTLLPEVSKHSSVFVWLDPDDAGISGSRKIATYCSMLDIPVHIVRSSKDPKYYSKEEIKQFINNARKEKRWQ